MTMFPNFKHFSLAGAGATIHGVIGGSGPPLLLIHGYPQSHLIWHRVALAVREAFQKQHDESGSTA